MWWRVFLLLFGGCAFSANLDAGRGSKDPNTGGQFAPPGGETAEGADGAPAPEREVEETFETPVATGQHLWVANPTSGRVAYINAATLEVATVPAGHGPTHVAAIGNTDTTIVINVYSNDATLLSLTATGITTKTYPLAAGMNQWATAASGRYAIAWTDARKLPNASKTLGFQDLTIVDLLDETVAVLSVGYRPTAIRFDATEAHAFAVTSDGISVIALDGSPHLVRHVTLTSEIATDVTIVGSTALARVDGSPDVLIANLETGAVTPLTLADIPTDLDIAPSGDKALAVLRETSSLAVITLEEPPVVTVHPLPAQNMGSATLAPGADVALLYTNASATEEVTIVSLSPLFAARPMRVYSRVLGAFATPAGDNAIVLHDNAPGEGAFSLMPLALELPAKIVSTLDAPKFVALSADSTRALVVSSGANRQSAVLANMPSFATKVIALPSRPLTAGIVEGARRAFVSQSHPSGRVTFIDLDTGDARTLTGFELQARIIGGTP